MRARSLIEPLPNDAQPSVQTHTPPHLPPTPPRLPHLALLSPSLRFPRSTSPPDLAYKTSRPPHPPLPSLFSNWMRARSRIQLPLTFPQPSLPSIQPDLPSPPRRSPLGQPAVFSLSRPTSAGHLSVPLLGTGSQPSVTLRPRTFRGPKTAGVLKSVFFFLHQLKIKNEICFFAQTANPNALTTQEYN